MPTLLPRREGEAIQRDAALCRQVADLLVASATLAMMVARQMAIFRVFEGYGNLGFKSACLGALNKTQNSCHSVKDEPRFSLVRQLVIVRQGIIIAHMIELLENTNRIFYDLARNVAQLVALF